MTKGSRNFARSVICKDKVILLNFTEFSCAWASWTTCSLVQCLRNTKHYCIDVHGPSQKDPQHLHFRYRIAHPSFTVWQKGKRNTLIELQTYRPVVCVKVSLKARKETHLWKDASGFNSHDHKFCLLDSGNIFSSNSFIVKHEQKTPSDNQDFSIYYKPRFLSVTPNNNIFF